MISKYGETKLKDEFVDEILEEAEQLRMVMHNLVREKGISDSSVLEVSQKLDNVIVKYYKESDIKLLLGK